MRLAAGADFHEQAVNQNADGIRLVSLGCYCGPKLSLRALKRDAETLPFDWVRTRIDGLLHFMQNDFDKFFHYDTRQVVPGAGVDKPMVMHRSYFHSFWHDDLTDDATFDKYRRRMERFNAIDARSATVLFVRSVVSTEELQHTEKLYDDLIGRFGRCSKLLVIVDFQTDDELVKISGLDNLLIVKLHHRAHQGDNGAAPYTKAISTGIEWARGARLPGLIVVPSISMVKVVPTSWGHQGLGGLDAFERSPGGGMLPLSAAEPVVSALAGAQTFDAVASQPAVMLDQVRPMPSSQSSYMTVSAAPVTSQGAHGYMGQQFMSGSAAPVTSQGAHAYMGQQFMSGSAAPVTSQGAHGYMGQQFMSGNARFVLPSPSIYAAPRQMTLTPAPLGTVAYQQLRPSGVRWN